MEADVIIVVVVVARSGAERVGGFGGVDGCDVFWLSMSLPLVGTPPSVDSADVPPGSDPALLRAHIQKLDPAIDDDYFAHLWQLLVRKPNVEVVVAEDDEEGDLRPVGEDEEFPARNLAGLLLKYPRVRVRGSDDEIYYRLTGSRKRVS